MNEVEAYQAVYGDLVYEIPHYHQRTHTVAYQIRPSAVNAEGKKHEIIKTQPSGDLVVCERLDINRR
jgi:hypothetical protein